jgi:hypothetical protein
MRGDLSQYVVEQSRVDPGIHAQYPISFISECGAFYRIFFGEEYRIAIGKGEICGAIGMMVGKRVRREGEAERFQMPEITLRMADARDRVTAQLAKLDGTGLS